MDADNFLSELTPDAYAKCSQRARHFSGTGYGGNKRGNARVARNALGAGEMLRYLHDAALRVILA